MKVVGLLSGGKDSTFNLMHCVKLGHTLVAVASLVPPAKQEDEELNSFMYQTVGLSVIPLIAEALGIPCIRRVITGSAKKVGKEYGRRQGIASKEFREMTQKLDEEGDETEDLYELLKEVKASFPDVEGVSVGAILSSYQRIRVEQVCARLGLTPLVYLWQAEQEPLIEQMISSGLVARLVKVAGAGLKVSHLGQTLEEMLPILKQLNEVYGLHVAGEGGEFETVTVDCPLFERSIKFDETITIIPTPDKFAPVAHLRVLKASLSEPKSDWTQPTASELNSLMGLDNILDEQAENVLSTIGEDWTPSPPTVAEESSVPTNIHTIANSRKGNWISVGNVTAGASRSTPSGTYETGSVEEEVELCFKTLEDELSKHQLTLTSITSINLLISSMSLFPQCNKVYSTFFGSSPPVRACVAVPLPEIERIRIEALAFAGDLEKRNVLHVQGLSHWAPANIGPYSQAVIYDERVFIAGQIPLIPPTLTLPSPPSLPLEIVLSLKHVRSIITAIKEGAGGGWKGHWEAMVCWLGKKVYMPLARNGWNAHADLNQLSSVPILFITASSLPKGAMVEWQPALHTSRPTLLHSQDSEDDTDDDESTRIARTPIWTSFEEGAGIEGGTCVFDAGASSSLVVACNSDFALNTNTATLNTIKSSLSRSFSLRIFHLATVDSAAVLSSLKSILDLSDGMFPATTFIPCRGIAGKKGDWELGLVALGV